ncbi:Cysteine-tRNA ligase, cytoplasmic [Coccomyxa sp. Obi]|nr:Cysteine-tRNA ligase, cytoplasmic [Coccomyxa sp. Obi]
MPQVGFESGRQKGKWRAPGDCRPAAQQGVLKLYNTLTKQKEEFVPLDPTGHHVTWYTCGPTVYDAAHLGHARYYVTMDILRRVLEDYFGYSISFVMNVTDVDDKIIQRARLNHLLQKYLAETSDTDKVLRDAEAALSNLEAKQRGAVSAAETAVQKEEQGGQRLKDLNERLSIEQTKLRKVLENVSALQRIKESTSGTENGAIPESSASQEPGLSRRDQIVQAAGDALAEALDKLHGGEVTDHEVFRRHAARYEEEFLEDLVRLNCRMPHVLTRVSEYMDEIREYVQQIFEKGFAYCAEGDVYFDTQAYRAKGHTYGKLAPQAINSAAAADGEADFATRKKRHPSDFALWKQAKPGEPAWESPECTRDNESAPLGKGRPGWHIECSAMASSIFRSQMDIHTGGIDLAFPHHENELAQAEAYFHEDQCNCEPQWVNYFLHAGHLNIDNMKMSKSLKNFISIRKALEDFSPRVLRIMFTLAPWDKPMTYKEEKSAAEARQKEKVFVNFFLEVDAVMHKFGPGGTEGRLPTRWEAEEKELDGTLAATSAKVHAALLDSIDVCTAVSALLDLVSKTNIYIKAREQHYAATPRGPPPQVRLLCKVAEYITKILRVFGIAGEDEIGLGRESGSGAAAAVAGEGAAPLLDAFADFRTAVRSAAKAGISDAAAAQASLKEVLAVCDRLRDQTLPRLGVQLEDRPDGTSICKFMTAAEQAEAKAAEKAREAKELKKKVEKLEKELKRLEMEKASMAQLEARWDKYTRAQKAVAEEGASDKQLKSEAKEVWKLLKKFKVTPANLSLTQEELRQMVESIPSREPPVNGKLAAEVADKWKTYTDSAAGEAGGDSKWASELVDLLYRALPDEANARLGELVAEELKESWQKATQAAIDAAKAELKELPSIHAGPSIVQ